MMSFFLSDLPKDFPNLIVSASPFSTQLDWLEYLGIELGTCI